VILLLLVDKSVILRTNDEILIWFHIRFGQSWFHVVKLLPVILCVK